MTQERASEATRWIGVETHGLVGPLSHFRVHTMSGINPGDSDLVFESSEAIQVRKHVHRAGAGLLTGCRSSQPSTTST